VSEPAKRRAPARKPMFEAGADAPARTYRNTTLQIELAPIPLAIYSAVEEARSTRQQFVRHVIDEEKGTYELHPVGMKPYNKVTGKDISSSDIVKGITTEDGKVVEISDEELQLETETTCEVIGFIDLSKLPYEQHRLICPVKFYQVRAQMLTVGREKRPNRGAENVLLLMFQSMQKQNLHALINITINKGEPARLGLLDHGGQLRILAFQDHVRQERPLGELEASAAHTKMIDQIITKRIGIVTAIPPNKDQSAAHLLKVVQAKLARKLGKNVAEVPQQTTDLPVGDLMSLIEKSLSGAKN
jgi:DNA end-binding protein Ku